MRETLDMAAFVYAAYAIGVGSTLALLVWSWRDMRHAEARREKARRK